MKEKNLFTNIAGYEDIKKELMTIFSWYQDKSLIENKKIQLPTGILFYGHPGNGKTLFIREYVKAMNAPSFAVTDSKSIVNAFKSARKEKFALVLIDEIDLLIHKDAQALRILQNELDGINKKGQILVLATTNSRRDLPSALIRPGRFDRLIEIDAPKDKDIEQLYRYYLKELGVDNSRIDLTHMIDLTRHCSCVAVKAICNDAFLRGKENLTTKDLEKAYERIILEEYTDTNPLDYKNYRVAIHEAGHAIMALRFRKDIKLYNAKFVKNGGYTRTYGVNEDYDSVEKRLEQIQISLSGAIAERIFFKRHDLGSVNDLQCTINLIRRLVERTGYSGLSLFVETVFDMGRGDTESHHLDCEKAAKRILKKQSHLVKRYLKKHKDEIKTFADLLYAKGEVTAEDVKTLFTKEIDNTPISKSLFPNPAIGFANEKRD